MALGAPGAPGAGLTWDTFVYLRFSLGWCRRVGCGKRGGVGLLVGFMGVYFWGCVSSFGGGTWPKAALWEGG